MRSAPSMRLRLYSGVVDAVPLVGRWRSGAVVGGRGGRGVPRENARLPSSAVLRLGALGVKWAIEV